MSISIAHPVQALFISLICIELLRHAAKEFNLLDRPNDRKRHSGEIPVVGGLGIICALLLSAMVVPGLCAAYIFLVVPAALLTILGLVDDAFDIDAHIKLAAQFCVAALTLVLNPDLALRLQDGPGTDPGWSVLAWMLTMVILVGAMNAINMMDGVDGLAGTVVAVALLFLLLTAWGAGADLIAIMALHLLMPVLAFLFFNARAPWRKSALVFLGDAGSLMLGFAITVLGLQLAGPSKFGWSAWALSFIIALPAIDTASLIVRRLSAGRSPLSADRQHLHHLLQDAGLSPGQVTLVLATASVLIGGLGLALGLLKVGTGVLLLVLAALFICHCVTVLLLIRRTRRASHSALLARPEKAVVLPSPEPAAPNSLLGHGTTGIQDR